MAGRWKIFYADGSTFSSADGTPAQAPATNVEVIVQQNSRGEREILDGANTNYEFYAWHPESNQWIIHNQSGLDQFLAANKRGVYLSGYYVDDVTFWNLHNRALDDTDFGDLTKTVVVRADTWTG